eukprot:7261118-Pyramimonas_sp.AAC.1
MKTVIALAKGRGKQMHAPRRPATEETQGTCTRTTTGTIWMRWQCRPGALTGSKARSTRSA